MELEASWAKIASRPEDTPFQERSKVICFFLMASWRAHNSILEAPRLDFGGFGHHVFEILGLLARKMQELISNLKLKLRNSSLELKLPVLPSHFHVEFGRDLLHRSQAEMLRRGGWAAVCPPGGVQSIELS